MLKISWKCLALILAVGAGAAPPSRSAELEGAQKLTCVKQGEYRRAASGRCEGTLEVQIDPKKLLILNGPDGWRAEAWVGGIVSVKGPDCNELVSNGSAREYLEGNANVYRGKRLIKNVPLKTNRFRVVAGPAYGGKLYLKKGAVQASLSLGELSN
ncbi:MAG: hypothetical protein HY921_02980 [Elusimicrobia bacterium]|nr:hypothetical protein [Elusimicrobiota bacterium]